jgi:(p)ppGpp synthase/HD superfamily hydrolase
MSSVERALSIAARAHQGQKEKNGLPYIMHPLRLMMRMSTDEERTAAVLHDVVEDTSVTLADLRNERFSEQVLKAVDCLTHRKEDTYDGYIARIKENPLSLKVKLADLEDNLDLKRLPRVTEKDLDRVKRYHRVWLDLKQSVS